MNILVHVSVAFFTGLLANDSSLGFWIVFAQLLPLADIGLKYLFGYEPLHTIWGLLILAILYQANLPLIVVYLTASHALHLILDVFAKEGIQPLTPWGAYKLAFPLQYSEAVVTGISILGMIVLFFLNLA